MNTYFPGLGTATAGATTISVDVSGGAAIPIAAGDLLLVIQMQGADINTLNTNAYGGNNASGAGYLATNFTAGQYEYVVAGSNLATGTAGTITLTTSLVNSYSTAPATASTGRRSFQVVRVPQYANVTLGGTVNALTWNGNRGGVLALDVAGTLTLNGQTLNAAGRGFRGGGGKKYGGANGPVNTDYRSSNASTVNASKGEGIAGTPRYTLSSQTITTATVVDNSTSTTAFGTTAVADGYPNGDNGRGAPGNAGGGGTDGGPATNGLNAGGAGGSNFSTGGFGGSPRNADGSATAVTTVRALAGAAVTSSPTRLVMGGGGGAGSSNDGNGDAGNTGLYSSGAPGGGIIIVRTGSISGNGTANAAGAGGYTLQGVNANGTVTNDATGGGGAGGTVLITARTGTMSGLAVTVAGGAGSSNVNNSDVAHGPGGGGSGGIILANAALGTTTVTGGAAGTTTYNNNSIITPTATSNFGATAGLSGSSTTNISPVIDNSVAGADCTADLSSAITATSFVNRGQSVTVQATFSNAGPVAAPATGTVTLPAGAIVTSAPGGTITVDPTTSVTTVTYAISSLNSGGNSSFTLAYTANTAGTVTVNSNVTSSTLDVVASNNASTASTTVSNVGAVGTPAPCATAGKDGSPSIAANPDTYYPSIASQTLNAGATSIAVGAATIGGNTATPTTITKGDLLLVIQMQGADINSNNTDAYGDGVAGGGASGNLNTNFTAGTYEYVVASNTTAITAASGGTITLATSLVNSYVNADATTTAGPRRFQVVRVPQYANLTLTGTLTATPWNGSTGGILAIDVAGTTNFGGNTIDASGRGFRGGGGRTQTTAGSAANLTDYVDLTSASSDQNAQKGEGTAGTPRFVNSPATPNDATTNATSDTGINGYPSGTAGRGAPGNAGGGGNDNINNSGGGGGANGNVGGRGGNNFSSNQAIGGEPGASFAVVSSSRLVLGGGGGAGTTNNATGMPGSGFASSGAAGGGIVLLRTGSVAGTGSILANGGNANNSVADDGSGGGGAGGSILVTANTPASLSNLTLSAVGGRGGTNTGGTSGNHGPGGGGGGGIILTNGSVASASVVGGASGTTKDGTSYNAAPGLGGVSNTSISNSIASSVSGATCPADVATTIQGPTSASAGQPTGTFMVTFANVGSGLATSVTQTVTLPTGAGLSAAQQAAIKANYQNATFTTTGSGTSTTTTINFGTLDVLASGASNTYSFAYTAPTTPGTVTTTGSANTSSTDLNPSNNTASVSTTVGAAADVTVALNGPTTLNAGQPTGNFTATFTNEGPSTAANVSRTVTLPAGATVTATQLAIIQANYPGTTYSSTTNALNFGTLASLASDASSAVTFAFTAPTTLGSSNLTGNTSTTTAEGSNSAPNQATLALTTVATADVVAAITATSTATTGTFNVTFSNNGPQGAAVVVRTVQLPAGLTGVTVTGGGTYNATTGLVTYSPSPTTLAAGSSLTSAISYSLASSATPVAATATISTTTNEAGQTANNTFTALMPASFDLATTLAGPTTAIAGSATTLYVTTTNSGPNNAPAAIQTVVIPSALPLTNVYITNGGTYTYNTTTKEGTVTFPSVANLPVGQVITNSISFSAPSGSFAPSAVVTVTSGDTNTNNNTAYLNGSLAATQVAVTPATTNQTNETTTIVADKTIVDAGTVVTYTVTATNKGSLNNPATANVTEQVQLVPGLTTSTLTVGGVTGTVVGNLIQFVAPKGTTSYDPATGIVTYPVLASQTSGDTYTFDKLAVTVPANAGNNGQLLATASVRTAQSDPTPADNTSSVAVKVQTPADLATTLTGATTATAGQATSYTATFVNRGTGSATNVQQMVQLPAGLTGVLVQDASGNVVNNAYNATTGLVTIPTLANMAAGASQVYGISFVAPAQSFPLTSSVSSGTTDPTTTNNSALLRTTVSPASDVAVYVSGPATAVAGNALTYAVTTANNGPSPASNVQATLQLPANLAGVTLTGGGSYDAASGLVTFPIVNLAAGDSRVSLVTFTMPANPTNGQINGQLSGSASVTTTSTDLVASNNTSAITTDVAPATSDMADLATSITASTTTATAGSAISYTLNFRNTSATTAATKVMPTAYLPAGLSNVVVTTVVNGATVVVPNAYNSVTGQVVLPTIDSQAPGNLTQYMVSLTAPANASTVAISASAVSSNTSDPNPANNVQGSSVNITPSYDAVTSLAGPLTAQPGSINTYTVTTTNNGPSTASNTFTQTVTLPAGVTATNITNGTQSGNVITFTAINNPVAGANGAVSNTFSIVMPATGSLPLTAAVTVGTTNATPESNTGNNQDALTTAPANQAPVAQNVWNTLQNARGNTANSLLISPLNATDPEGSSLTYKVATLPASSQGVLYLANGSAVAVGQTVPVNGLYFAPNPNFVGNATFTYQAVDNASATSNEALYTIPVAQDQAATYAPYNSGKPNNAYAANDVLAQVVDPNAAAYNSSGVIYNATSGLEQTGTSNGVASAVLSSGTLPAGTALRTSTITDGNGGIRPAGEIYVTDPSLLPALANAMTYTVQIAVTDLNGGITTVPATFTLGASPLPVSLVAFTAQAVQNRDALLKWTTASELSNDHFEVERSLDGTTFVQVGQQQGQGTKATATDYSFTDAGIGARAAGQPVYYRLKQVDLNGTSTYSPVRSVSFTKAIASLVTLYPNPAVAATNLDLSALPAGNTYQVLLLDVTGRQVQAATLAGGQPQPLNLSNLATGTYHVVVTGTQADGSALRQTLRLTKE